jgi:hypothetical protein
MDFIGLRSIEAEFDGARLGDGRLEYRLPKIAKALQQSPDVSLPKALKSDAKAEGAYRLLRNENVTVDGILAGHYEQTIERAQKQACVVAIHDTTIFEFSGDAEREGLGPLRGKGQGFLGHFTLLAAVGTPVVPLGVLSVEALVRARQGKKKENEGDRWLANVEATEQRLAGQLSVIHLMDREADAYDLMAGLIEGNRRFVIRASYDRALSCGENLRISDLLANAKGTVERTVALSKRVKKNANLTNKHPAREARTARLALSATMVKIARPASADADAPEMLQVNIVEVREIQPPPGAEPVHWRLITTEPISKPSDLEHVVDCYRARWMIEEYFKAIKTGCAFEKRQMESLKTLLNILAIIIPIAWRLLLLRTLARQTPDIPATKALTKTQLAILGKRRYGHLPPKATVREAMLAVARMGGFLRQNGEPGWIVLGRGFEDLLKLEEGWLAAKGDI